MAIADVRAGERGRDEARASGYEADDYHAAHKAACCHGVYDLSALEADAARVSRRAPSADGWRMLPKGAHGRASRGGRIPAYDRACVVRGMGGADVSWIKCSERLPDHNGPATFYGGKASPIVIGLWTNGKQPQVRQCIHIDYSDEYWNREDCDPADGWMDVDEYGSCDRCTSHRGHAPTAWMPMPPINEGEPEPDLKTPAPPMKTTDIVDWAGRVGGSFASPSDVPSA